MKKSSKMRRIGFELTEDDLKSWWLSNPDVCEYCGCNIEEYTKIRDFVVNYNGDNEEIKKIKETVFNKDIYKKIKTMTIDRVDSSDSYKTSNLVKSCWICNSLKSNKVSFAEMKKMGKHIRLAIEGEMKK